jgi:hypothetical protein
MHEKLFSPVRIGQVEIENQPDAARRAAAPGACGHRPERHAGRDSTPWRRRWAAGSGEGWLLYRLRCGAARGSHGVSRPREVIIKRKEKPRHARPGLVMECLVCMSHIFVKAHTSATSGYWVIHWIYRASGYRTWNRRERAQTAPMCMRRSGEDW